MSKLPLVEGVLSYVKKNKYRLSMPGHKGGKGFLGTKAGEEFYSKLVQWDITEVDGVDNLHHPEGIIKEAEELTKELYKSAKSYFLVNGSTSGNLAMIFAALNEGDKVLVERHCHRSVFNGIILRKLTPVYIENEISSQYNAPLSIDEEHFIHAVEEHPDAKAVILTYPNYYGNCAPLNKICSIAHKNNMKVLVDSAHGAHFGMHKELPEHALNLGADMVVMSAHKTLPALTGGAYLHLKNPQDIEQVNFYVSAFTTTSPSYLIMCSLDYSRYFLEEHGQSSYEELIRRAKYWKAQIEDIGPYVIWGEDPTRFSIHVKDGGDGSKLFQYLEENGITPEMCDNSNVVCIFSPFNEEEDFKMLFKILKQWKVEYRELKNDSLYIYPRAEGVYDPWRVVDMPKERLPLKDCLGKISGENLVPYPPGVPLITMGERIDTSHIKALNNYLNKNIEVLGVYDGCINVLRD